eukprot:evm.model.scf_17.11 EVM.evm.TU.scf_17.11   scf_17:135000-142945(-)
MGLGKTLQAIAAMWALMAGGIDGRPACRRPLVICPSSLVANWGREVDKWLGGRAMPVAVENTEGGAVRRALEGGPYRRSGGGGLPVLIMSYTTFRLHREQVLACKPDVLICDEAHLLKNKSSQIAVATSEVPTKMRLLLTGTPIQNNLLEFHALVDIANPGVLGDASQFHKHYEEPILRGRDAGASDGDIKRGEAASARLLEVCSKFLLRRNSSILQSYLPPKVEQVLSLCQRGVDPRDTKRSVRLSGFEGAAPLYRLPDISPAYQEGRAQAYHSGKVLILDCLLKAVRKAHPADKVVVVSNYTETLDMAAKMCLSSGWRFLKLDGSCATKLRQNLVEQFNDEADASFVFLLSSKAGGVGLNIVGANRLVLLDPDWNPANDLQAMARVWREGQTKTVWIYRLLTTGTIEEKIYQRQLAKLGLCGAVVDDQAAGNAKKFCMKELKSLFTVDPNAVCDTHTAIKCGCSGRGPKAGDAPPRRGGNGHDVLSWGHFEDVSSSPDPIWDHVSKWISSRFVTFVFCDHVAKQEKAGRDSVASGSSDVD